MADKKKNYDLSIIIVSWNVKDKLRENLNALYKSQGDLNFEVFVVDNNSADGSAKTVKEEFPQVNLMANIENLGFAKANNQAIRQASGELILLLNPDMRVRPDTLSNMLAWMRENKQASVAGCHLIDEQGDTVKQVRRFPAVRDQLAIVLKLPHLFPGVLKKYLRHDFDYSRAAKVNSIRGGFMMINLRAVSVEAIHASPLLDERYFLWFEEVDFCQRVKQAGGEVWYTPAAECVDYVGQSFSQLPRGESQKYFRDSMLKYFKKWQPAWQYWLLRLAWPIGISLVVIAEKLNIQNQAKT